MRTLSPLLVLLMLAGCQVGPDYDGPPNVPHQSKFSGSGGGKPTLDKWWRKLGSRELNGFVARALKNNQDIGIAGQRLREARAMRKQAASSFLPKAGANLSFSRIDYAGLVDDSVLRPITESGFLDSPLDYWGSGLDISWEIDVFGGKRREARGARAREQAALEALHGARLAIASEVTETYFTIVGLRDQLAKVNAQVALQQKQSADMRERVDAGASSRLDLDRASARLETTRSEAPTLEAGIGAQIRRLALLLGERSDSLTGKKMAAGSLPATLPMARAGIPAELVLRRPDLRQSERELAAATEDIGVAVANFYPKFRIGGGPSSNAASFGDLFNASSFYWQYGPRVEWAVFSGGANRAALEKASARQKVSMLGYEKSVLSAIGEVESELENLRAETRKLAIVQRAGAATAAAVKRVQENHDAGASDYVEVLVEEERLREVEITEIRVKNQMIQIWIRLHKALGGGWEE